MIPGKSFKNTTYAIGFGIEDSSSEDGDAYAIMRTSNFALGWYQEYLLKLE